MLVPIANTPRDYAWGSRTALAELTGRAPSGGHEAELWLGAHPGSPAVIAEGEPGRTLLDVVPGRLPFLLKLLAAESPLSLQAHPTPEQAEEGFAREEAAGVPIDAPERNYKDRFHKPELIYALSDPFLALCGFRPVAETVALLDPLADDPRIRSFRERLTGDDAIERVFTWLIGGGDDVEALVAALVEASAVADDLAWDTVRRLADAYPGDPGIAISLLMHTARLAPGEALYLPAGNIHAYLEGVGVELMASSDNVLRGGLTPKHVDVAELSRVLDFRPLPLPRLLPEEPRPGVRVFRPDVPDFVLEVLTDAALADGVEVALGGRPAIALALGGSAGVGVGGTDRELSPGGAVYVADEAAIRVSGEPAATVFVATTSLAG